MSSSPGSLHLDLRGLGHPLDLLRATVEASAGCRPIFAMFEAKFGGYDDLILERFKRFAYQFFVGEGTVHFGRIKEGDAPLYRFVEKSDHLNYFLATIELPRVSQVLEASKEQPYLSFRLVLDPNLVGSVMIEAGHVIPSGNADVRAIDVSSLDAELLDAVVRLVRLVDSPAEARILMPLIKREIIYRLLTGDQGGRLCHLTVSAGYTSNIARAVERFRHDFDQPLRDVERLRETAGQNGRLAAN